LQLESFTVSNLGLPARLHSARGYLSIAAATFCWGVSATLGRAAFTGRLFPGNQTLAPVDPLILSQTRVTFAFLVFLSVLLWRRGGRRLQLPAADFGRMLLLGVLGVAASNYFYYLAIQRTNVATAIMVQYTAPVWVLLYMVARRLQRPTLPRLVAVALVVTGIALVIGRFGRNGLDLDRIGLLAALLTAFSFALYNVGAHSLLRRYDRWMVLLYMTFSASLFWIVVNPPWRVMAEHYSGEQWLFLLGFSVVSLLVPFSFYIGGLRYLDPTRAVVVSCLEPVFSVVIAALVLGELVHPLQIFGMVLVLVAIVLVEMPDQRSGEAVVVEPIE
jgi:drug/metabolite transporter (DMT)-like permease